MIASSKATNVFLGIIAICLVVMALRPVDLIPVRTAGAQIEDLTERGDTPSARLRSSPSDLASEIVSSRNEETQIASFQSIANSMDSMAKSFEAMALSIDGLSRSIAEIGERMAGGAAGVEGAGVEPDLGTVEPSIRVTNPDGTPITPRRP